MTAASYASDLTTILADMPATTGWTALGGGASGLVAPETDFFIQGSNCISKAGWNTATKGMIYSAGAQSIPSTSAVYMWVYFWAPNSLTTESGGGLQVLVGSTAAAFRQYYIRGSDTLTYGGWICAIVEPNFTADATTGAPSTTTFSFFGAQATVPGSGPSKGQPLGIDAFRFGRDLAIINGDSSGYGTFSGSAAYNDDVSRRNGQFQKIDGGYLSQCRFLMGSGSNPVDFRDSNVNITLSRLTKVTGSFHRFEVQNTGSRVDWNNISVATLTGSVSRGDFVVTHNATVNLTGSTFTDMGNFNFLPSTTAYQCTFRRCQKVTQSGSIISECVFDSTRASTSSLLANNPTNITKCRFVSGDSGKHGFECRTTGTFTFAGNTFTGYVSGSNGNEAFYNNSGGLITLNITTGGDTPTYRNSVGSSTVINSNVSVTLTGLKNPSEVRVFSAGTTTELAGQETITGGSFVFSIASGQSVDISILSLGYQNQRLLSYSTTADASIPITQIIDRQYLNP